MNNDYYTHYAVMRSLIEDDEWRAEGYPGEPPLLAHVKIEGDTVTLNLETKVLFHDEVEYQFRPR